MAFPASPSVGIRKTDGLLARVGELCGMIRASYLSPFFPLALIFELWRYLRPWLQTGCTGQDGEVGKHYQEGSTELQIPQLHS
jgi:hypothetical protein